MPRSRKPVSDRSLGQCCGASSWKTEVVENLIEPLLSGIYAGDIDEMADANIPQMYRIEQKHRSISLGMRTLAPKEES